MTKKNAIECSADTVRAMIRDGLVEAHKHRNRWYIPVREAAQNKPQTPHI